MFWPDLQAARHVTAGQETGIHSFERRKRRWALLFTLTIPAAPCGVNENTLEVGVGCHYGLLLRLFIFQTVMLPGMIQTPWLNSTTGPHRSCSLTPNTASTPGTESFWINKWGRSKCRPECPMIRDLRAKRKTWKKKKNVVSNPWISPDSSN